MLENDFWSHYSRTMSHNVYKKREREREGGREPREGGRGGEEGEGGGESCKST